MIKYLDWVGSVVRDDFCEQNSDIDLLFAFEGGDNLFHRYFDLKFGLEALFGCLVDVI